MAARTARPEADEEITIEPEESEVTRPSDLGFGRREIEVEPIQPVSDPASGFMQIRMARTIDEFTYGNPHVFYKLEEGKVYQVPIHIGLYLRSLGAISNIA